MQVEGPVGGGEAVIGLPPPEGIRRSIVTGGRAAPEAISSLPETSTAAAGAAQVHGLVRGQIAVRSAAGAVLAKVAQRVVAGRDAA